MSEDVRTLPNRRPQGLAAELEKLFGSVVRHLTALGSLASEEGREAMGRFLRMAALFFAAVFMMLFGYGTLLVFIGILAVKVLRVDALWVSLGMVVIQLGIAVVCGLVIRAWLKLPLFPITTQEIRKDLESFKTEKP